MLFSTLLSVMLNLQSKLGTELLFLLILVSSGTEQKRKKD
jgi:hypothetical protein